MRDQPVSEYYWIGATLTGFTTTGFSGTMANGSFGGDTIIVADPSTLNVDKADYRGFPLSGITTIQLFGAGVRTIFGTTQFNGTAVSPDVTISGSFAADTLIVVADPTTYGAAGFSAAGFKFQYWTAGTDQVLIYANDYGDSLTGTSRNDVIYGGGGDDNANVLKSGSATNYLYGLGGNDTFVSGGTSDQFWGGAGSDTVSYAGRTVSVYADLGSQTGYVNGVLVDRMNSIENLAGGSANDILIAGSDANVLAGAGGADSLYAGNGADTFAYAAYGDSNLNTGYDTIVDFKLGTDKIDISALHLGAANLAISTSGTSNTLYVEQTPGAFNQATDLALVVNTTTTGGLHASDFVF